MSTMSIIFVKLFLLGRFKAGDFARGGIGVGYEMLVFFSSNFSNSRANDFIG